MGSEGKEPMSQPPDDSAPEFGGAVKRKIRGGKEVSIPIVTQLGLPEDGLEPQSTRLVNTQRKLKSATPIERLAIETAEGHQDPVTRKKAERQSYAIIRNIQRRTPKSGR